MGFDHQLDRERLLAEFFSKRQSHWLQDVSEQHSFKLHGLLFVIFSLHLLSGQLGKVGGRQAHRSLTFTSHGEQDILDVLCSSARFCHSPCEQGEEISALATNLWEQKVV
jgi:hypothetical protein